jgi:Fe-S cluster biogenesis protein NfuA
LVAAFAVAVAGLLVVMPTTFAEAAAFSPRLTVRAPAGGRVTGSGGISCPGTCSATFRFGRRVTLTAQPVGTVFVEWGGACSGSNPTCVLVMDGNKTVTATFAIVEPLFRLTVVEPAGGTVVGSGGVSCPSTCSRGYAVGEQVTLTAQPVGTVFVEWGGACSGSNPTCVLVMDGDKTVTATFAIVDPCPPVCEPVSAGRTDAAAHRSAGAATTSRRGPAIGRRSSRYAERDQSA